MNKIENLKSSSKKENTTKESEQRKVKIEVSKGHKVFQDIDGPREIIVKCSCDDPMYIKHAVPCSCTYCKNHTQETSKDAGISEYVKDQISYNCSKVTENNLENDTFSKGLGTIVKTKR